MKRPLVLIGGGGHCRSVIDVAEAAGYVIEGILDVRENVGKHVLGYPILGVDDDIPKFLPTCQFHVTVGQIKDNSFRKRLFLKAKESGCEMASIVSPKAHVSRHASIGEGCAIMHMAVVNASARIGSGVIVNTFANIEHDVTIGDFCHISTGAMVNGDCNIGDNCFIGSGAAIANGISICSNAFISIGAVVVKNIDEPGFYAGIPAQKRSKS
jgi:sugar O-acyltransferase (sialic acid O-acetyltransferase NeuD family)